MFDLHLSLCEGVGSPGTVVSDSCEMWVLGIEAKLSGRAANGTHGKSG